MGILLLTVWASRAVGWTLPWFGVSFSEYTPGETLSDSGAAGGGWEALSASVTATNAPADGLAAIALASGSALPQAVFAASAPAGQDLWTVEANLFPEEPRDFGVGEIDGPVAITFVAGGGGSLVVRGVWAAGGWRLADVGVRAERQKHEFMVQVILIQELLRLVHICCQLYVTGNAEALAI